jgi:menaquinol-cytochrome c reductase iron-sulfur subunit
MTEGVSSEAEAAGRRKFLAGIIGVVAGLFGAAVAIPAIVYVVSPAFKKLASQQWVPLGPVSALTPGVPSGFPYSVTTQDGWVESTRSGVAWAITLDGVKARVLSDVCTHLGCRVTWEPGQSLFSCPCHSGFFSSEGRVVSGPPPRPLDEFVSKVDNGQISILVET